MSFRAVRTNRGLTLEVRLSLKTADQIFDLRDPAPFREKDLDDDFARYLLVAIEEEPDCKYVRLFLNVPQGSLTHFSVADIEQAIREYFQFETTSLTGEIKSILNEGRWAMVFGSVFLFACQFVVYFIGKQEGFVAEAVIQGLEILGWVALWQPTNLLLYAWWPVLRKRNLVTRLSKLTVEQDVASPTAQN